MKDGAITDDKSAGIPGGETVSESGSKYFSSQDIANFLSGRDVMAARKVDFLCDMAKSSQMVQEGLTKMFNQARPSSVFSNSDAAAFLKVIQKPEFKEIKERFEKIGTALSRSMEALDEDSYSLLEARNSFASHEKIFVGFDNELSKALVCHKGFMDPLAEISNLPPLNPHTVKSFEKALGKEQGKLLMIELQDAIEGTDKFSRELRAVKAPDFIK